MQRSGIWCGEEVAELNHFCVGNVLESAGWDEEVSFRFAFQRERKSVVPMTPTGVARSERYYLLLFSTGDAALEKMVSKDMATES